MIHPNEIDCPVVSWEELVQRSMAGDLIFEWSYNPIADIIEDITAGPSHVMQLAKFPQYDDQMYEFEAIFLYGVRLLPLSHYQSSRGYRILCKRDGMLLKDIMQVTDRALTMLGRKYEVVEELEIAVQHLAPWVKVGETDNRVFCSGLIQYTFDGSSVAFDYPLSINATPVQLFLDKKTLPICKCAPS